MEGAETFAKFYNKTIQKKKQYNRQYKQVKNNCVFNSATSNNSMFILIRKYELIDFT
jgi:hypothetical protein